jgi:hypothetical protein
VFLKANAQSTVDVPAFDWCPRIDGPAAVNGARWEKQRIPSRLSDTSEVLDIHEDTHAPELLFRQEPGNHVRLARHAAWILVKTLRAV